MIINKQQMDEINDVQYEIFKAFHNVCKKLNLNYYLVHGSLLGALKYHGFFPMDDDIDVAMPRKDYDKFMNEGVRYIDDKFFIQSHLSEQEYPLPFGKIRANGTAFIQPVLQNCNINKGIYIDVFPIDNFPESTFYRLYLSLKEGLYKRRVFLKLNTGVKTSFKSKVLNAFLVLFIPSWRIAVKRLCSIYTNVKYTGKVIVRGGKVVERGIDSDLFGTPVSIPFIDINSYSPEKTREYLSLIYGDYMNYEPMGKDMVSENEVKISADVIDTQRSYMVYEKY